MQTSGAPFPISWGGTLQQNGYYQVPKDVIFLIFSHCLAQLPILASLCQRWKQLTREYGDKYLLPIAFGKKQYEEYIGQVPDEPPIPLAAVEYIVRDPIGYLLTLIPKTINGKPVTMNYIDALAEKPLKGHSTGFNCVEKAVRKEYGNVPNETAYWMLWKISLVGAALDEQTQEALVKQENLRSPELLGAITSIFMQRISKGKFALTEAGKSLFTLVKQSINGQRVFIGDYSEAGLDVWATEIHFRNDFVYTKGIAGARKSNGV